MRTLFHVGPSPPSVRFASSAASLVGVGRDGSEASRSDLHRVSFVHRSRFLPFFPTSAQHLFPPRVGGECHTSVPSSDVLAVRRSGRSSPRPRLVLPRIPRRIHPFFRLHRGERRGAWNPRGPFSHVSTFRSTSSISILLGWVVHLDPHPFRPVPVSPGRIGGLSCLWCGVWMWMWMWTPHPSPRILSPLSALCFPSPSFSLSSWLPNSSSLGW